MTSVNDTCRRIREDWLERANDAAALASFEREERHVVECADCARWAAAMRAQVETLSSLSRKRIPERVATSVDGDLAQPPILLERALRSLPRPSAPSELALLVSRSLATPRPAVDPVRSLQILDVAMVPDVLERLIDEELGEPRAHRVDRFVGNLDPRRAPDELVERTDASLRQSSFRRLVLFSLASVAAAILVLWFAVLGRNGSDASPARSFRVVRAETLDQLDPFARQLASALGGGIQPAAKGLAAPQEKDEGG